MSLSAVRDLPGPKHPDPSAASSPIAEAATAAFTVDGANGNIPGHAEDLDRQCIALEAEIVELRHRLSQTDPAAQEREDSAYARGLDEGERRALKAEDDRIALTATALEKLHATHEQRLEEYELLALQLARTALGRIFGDERLHGELVNHTLSNALGDIRKELIVDVRVSAVDFPNEEALSHLTRRFPSVEISISEKLHSGDCTIDLKLGRIDLGLKGQWASLNELFENLAREDVSR